MSVLKTHFNPAINQSSPIQDDYNRVVNYDDEGNEYITYEKVDYSTLQAELGTAAMWSLKSLLAAGVDPAFPIHTGNQTRLESFDDLQSIINSVDRSLKALSGRSDGT